jgi:hypothetical protein
MIAASLSRSTSSKISPCFHPVLTIEPNAQDIIEPMLLSLAIGVPPSSHFIYIPAVLVLGLVLGFMMGSKATRDAYALEERKAAEREARRAAREARAGGGGAAAASADKPQ